MYVKNGAVAAAWLSLAAATTLIAAQGVPSSPAPPAQGGQPQAPSPAGAPRGQGRGGGTSPATYPAQQRPAGDPALIARGKALYGINCQGCHGVDLRGGDQGGPNLLRSQVVLSDENGELILPIVRGARQTSGMDPINISESDVNAVATYIHSVVATAKDQGAPPGVGIPAPSALVGDGDAGQVYFASKCSRCHSPTGDFQGIGSRFQDAKALQNRWVSGGAGGRGGGGRGGVSDARTVTATLTTASGEKIEGRLVRVDDFLVTLAQADGTIRSFRRDGDRPKVEIHDPMQAHRSLLSSLTDKDMHDVTAYLASLK